LNFWFDIKFDFNLPKHFIVPVSIHDLSQNNIFYTGIIIPFYNIPM
jgi:hypothetical protein